MVVSMYTRFFIKPSLTSFDNFRTYEFALFQLSSSYTDFASFGSPSIIKAFPHPLSYGSPISPSPFVERGTKGERFFPVGEEHQRGAQI